MTRNSTLQVFEALKAFFKEKPAFIFHGFEPKAVQDKMETDFLVVLPDCTVIAIECKTTLSKDALRDAKRQWNNTKRVLENHIGLGKNSGGPKFVRILCFEKSGPAKYKECESCPRCNKYLVKFSSDQKDFQSKLQVRTMREYPNRYAQL